MSDDVDKYPVFGLYFRRYAPFDTFAGADLMGRSEGDHRTSASTSLQATSRTFGILMFNRTGYLNKSFAGTSGTTTHFEALGFISYGDGYGIADVSIVVLNTFTIPDYFGFVAHTAGGYPLAPAAITPNIDTFIVAQVDFRQPGFMRVTLEAFGDNFPNLEVFIRCYRSGRSALLIDGRTKGDRDTGPYLNLWGSHRDHSLAKIVSALSLDDKGELATAINTVTPVTLPDYPEDQTPRDPRTYRITPSERM